MARRAYDHDWQRVRLAVLERDGHLCQLRGERCTGAATQVDHIVPLAEGGARLDPSNLRASCQQCNLGRVSGRSAALAAALGAGAARGASREW